MIRAMLKPMVYSETAFIRCSRGTNSPRMDWDADGFMERIEPKRISSPRRCQNSSAPQE